MTGDLYLLEEHVGDERFEFGMHSAPFGPGFSKEDLSGAARIEVWCTSIRHPEEFTEFRLLDSEDNVVMAKRINGY